jgi:hypothetical protein
MTVQEKEYTLKIKRTQYDRIADAFELEDSYFISYNSIEDTVIFSITESQRKWFSKFAKKIDNPEISKKHRATYWITQMFLPRNIKDFIVEVE